MISVSVRIRGGIINNLKFNISVGVSVRFMASNTVKVTVSFRFVISVKVSVRRSIRVAAID